MTTCRKIRWCSEFPDSEKNWFEFFDQPDVHFSKINHIKLSLTDFYRKIKNINDYSNDVIFIKDNFHLEGKGEDELHTST